MNFFRKEKPQERMKVLSPTSGRVAREILKDITRAPLTQQIRVLANNTWMLIDIHNEKPDHIEDSGGGEELTIKLDKKRVEFFLMKDGKKNAAEFEIVRKISAIEFNSNGIHLLGENGVLILNIGD